MGAIDFVTPLDLAIDRVLDIELRRLEIVSDLRRHHAILARDLLEAERRGDPLCVARLRELQQKSGAELADAKASLAAAAIRVNEMLEAAERKGSGSEDPVVSTGPE